MKTITFSGYKTGHVQGIAVDAKREYIYLSFTTCLVKADMSGNVVGTVTGLAGHLGCIAYNYDDGKVYGSLEFKKDGIGKSILKKIGRADIEDGFYMTVFDVDKINRMDMDACNDGVMKAVYLKEPLVDYLADGHRYGCSGIDGTTFARLFGSDDQKNYLYVAYGIYGDVARTDNDNQVILRYDISDWDKYALPLDQDNMHKSGPAVPDSKYFLFTGNTVYGVQNLEYDPYSDTILAAVYKGEKEQFPNYPLYFIDCKKSPEENEIFLANIGENNHPSGICGSNFPHGSTGIASLGNGDFLVSEDFKNEDGYGTVIKHYHFDKAACTFEEVE